MKKCQKNLLMIIVEYHLYVFLKGTFKYHLEKYPGLVLFLFLFKSAR